MRRILDDTFHDNLLKSENTASVKILTDGVLETYWQGKMADSAIEISFDEKLRFDRLVLQENITEGQRIEEFALECWVNGAWKVVAEGTTVGYKRMLRFAPIETDKMRIVVKQSRDVPQIAEIGLYKCSDEEAFK